MNTVSRRGNSRREGKSFPDYERYNILQIASTNGHQHAKNSERTKNKAKKTASLLAVFDRKVAYFSSINFSTSALP